MLAFSFCSEIRHIAYKEKKVLKKKGMVSMGNRLVDLDLKEEDGILYSKHGKILEKCPEKRTGDVIIPEGTTKIAERAFMYSGISSVKFPDSLRVIGHEAFKGCENLCSVEFGHGVKEIGKDRHVFVFAYCKNLKNIVIPDQVETIGPTSFYCSGIESVILPKDIKRIGAHAFCECRIHDLYIPSADIKIGAHAFGTTEHVTIADAEYLPEGVVDVFVDSGHADGCTTVKITQNGKSAYIPRILIQDAIVEMGDDAVTIDDMVAFTQEKQSEIVDFLLDINEEKGFCDMLRDIDFGYEGLKRMLKKIEKKRPDNLIMKAAVLNKMNKTENGILSMSI